MTARRIAADAAELRRRRDPDAAVEGFQRNHDPGEKLGRHFFAIEMDDLRRHAGFAVLRQIPAAAVVAVVDRQFDREDFDFQHVAGFCTLDIDRTGEDMPAWAAALARHLVHDGFERWLNFVIRHARLGQSRRRIGQQGINVDDVARVDPQHRRRIRPVIAVSHGCRRSLEPMGLRRVRRGACGGESKQSREGNEDFFHGSITLSQRCAAAAPV